MLMHWQVASWTTASALAKAEALVLPPSGLALRASSVSAAKNSETHVLVLLALFNVHHADVAWAD
jgi:hypothetical protein